MKWAIACFKFFASLKLGIVLLVLLGLVFAVGTFLESCHGAQAAQMLIYRTPWLALLFILLALNLLASALDRIPWKKKHIGFLTTHLGIILILLGSLVTQAFGIEGQIAIEEGRAASRITLAEPLLQILSIDSGQRWTFFLKPRVFAWQGRENLTADFPNLPLQAHLVADYPKAMLVERVQKTENGSPALHVLLKGSMASAEEWLFLEDPSRNSISLGPAVIRFAEEPIQLMSEKNPEMGKLIFQFANGGSNEIHLGSSSVGKTFPLKDTPYQAKVKQILKDAIVDQNRLVDRSDEWNNPAVELMLEGGGLFERHTIFAKFPEFPTLHGLAPSEARVRIAYEIAGFSKESSQNELRFIFNLNGLPNFQVKKGSGIKEGKTELGKEFETGWMDFKFVVDSYFEHARIEEDFLPLKSTTAGEDALPAIQVEFEASGSQSQVWLPQGEIAHVALGSSNYHVMYGLKTKPLGFSLELIDFMIETDPGTDHPAAFKSKVVLRDVSQGLEREVLIQMNEPLKHRGFKVYQSAYHLEPGKPDISIFTAARDPGNPLKYAGAIVMVGGILMLFYVKPFSTLKSSDPKLRSK